MTTSRPSRRARAASAAMPASSMRPSSPTPRTTVMPACSIESYMSASRALEEVDDVLGRPLLRNLLLVERSVPQAHVPAHAGPHDVLLQRRVRAQRRGDEHAAVLVEVDLLRAGDEAEDVLRHLEVEGARLEHPLLQLLPLR